MFRFGNPEYLYLLVLIPILALVRFYVIHRQKQKLRIFGDLNLVKDLMPDVSVWRPRIKFWLLELGIAVLVIAIARPQIGTSVINDKRVGIETIIALDISNSMLAEDVEPNRLVRSKMLVENLIDKFTNDKVGLIVFAGESFVQLPITSDFVSAKMFLNTIEPSLIDAQGTDIAGAIDMASNSFTKQRGIGKAIILITDGENHEGGANEAALRAKENGMAVFVLGIGTTQGSPIIVDGREIKDINGNIVMSALNEAMCEEIAKAGGGAYIHVNNNSDAQRLLDIELAKLSKNEISNNMYTEHGEQFQVFCLIALLVIIIEICIFERKNPIFRNIRLFDNRKTLLLIIMMALFSVPMYGQVDRSYIRSGNKNYKKANYSEAEVYYRKAQEKNKKNPQAIYNLGNALLMQKKDSVAIRQYEEAARIETNIFRKARSFHNIGVICQNHKMYSEAIESYKNSLRLNPNDDETRYNLELCKRQLKQQKEQEKKDNQKMKQNNKEDNQKEDKRQKQQPKDNQEQDKPKGGMSKENAEQLLNAVIQQEKDAQQKMKKAMQQPRSRRNQKNW